MSHWRAIHDQVRDSESLSDLSHLGERVFWRVVAQTDAWGRMRGEARKVRANCLPMVDVTDSDVEAALAELEASGRVQRYFVDDATFLQVIDFDEHQPSELRRRRSASRYPEPPDQSGSSPGAVREQSGKVTAQRREERKKRPTSPDGEVGGAAPGAVRESGSNPDFVGHFVDEVRRVSGRDPLPNAKGRIGRHANDLRGQGVSDDVILKAITEVVEAGLTVGAVLSVADQVHRGGYRGHKPTNGNGGLSAAELAGLAVQLEESGQ